MTDIEARVRPSWRRWMLGWMLAGLLAIGPAAPAVAQAANPPTPDAPGSVAPATASWPHSLSVDGAAVVVYQPQAISWPDHGTLTARAAVAITPAGAKTPILGTVEIALATRTDMATRSVFLSSPSLVASHFPTLDTARAAQFEAKIPDALARMQTAPVPLDSLLLSLDAPAQPSVPVKNDPPTIFHSQRPASLLVFDGQPVLAPIGKTGLSVAVNANWEVVVAGKTWFMLNNGLWLSALAATGPYTAVSKLPAAFSAIPNDPNFSELRKNVPAHPPKSAADVPTIFVSTSPAEIIVTVGPPRFVPIAGSPVQYAVNTEADLFRDTANGQVYYLVSGRWFAAPGLSGPWRFATDDLPPEFAMIPPESQRGRVLTAVPGTAQAQAAVLAAQIPVQATLSRAKARLHVDYAGPPQFAPIPGTPLAYAVNTSFQVLRVGSEYYAVYQGAWFVSAAPTGPWVLAASVPPEVYTIPPSSPLYPVTYVKVYAATPTAVTYGYTAGYALGFVSAGVLVYGSGYYYPPVVVAGTVPAYFPYPHTYTGNVWYNSASGAWARGGTVYGPYGGAATGGTYYNPSNGAYARGGAVYGPYGGASAWSAYNPSTGAYAHGSATWNGSSGTAYASGYNPRTGVSASTTQNANAYQRWGSSVISGPNQTVNTASGSNARGSAGGFTSTTGAAGAGYHGVNGNNAGVVRGANGNVYAGRDGNVYQHSSSGWSQWSNGGWQPAQTPSNASTRTQGSQSRNQTSSVDAAQTQYRSQSSGRTASTQGATGAQMTGAPMSSASYDQLQRDQQARTAGAQQWGQGGGGGRFGGGRFGGSGGGRFRR